MSEEPFSPERSSQPAAEPSDSPASKPEDPATAPTTETAAAPAETSDTAAPNGASSVASEPEATPAPAADDAAPEQPEPTSVAAGASGAAATAGAATTSGATPAAQTTPAASETGAAPAESFEKLLEASDKAPREVKVGERVRGKIVSIEDEHTFIDYSGRSEARIATSELRNPDGKMSLRVGDALSATVASVEDGVTLTLGKKRGVVHAARLRTACEEGIPVSGTVKGVNKGGFDVQISGVRAFCPLSQIDRAYVEDPKVHVGKSYRFRVLRWENGGRNIVVSRKALLDEENQERAAETRKQLAVGAEFDGQVTRVQPFGAFVDIGGLEGLLHISRMGHGHVADPTSVVKPGQTVRVRVVKLENEGGDKERISLALADLGPDPWQEAADGLQIGSVVHGKVVRLTTFGAFVQLEQGIDGLVHISELAPKRVEHPRDVVKPGEEVEVRILKIDKDKRRVSLSMRQAKEEAAAGGGSRASRPPRREHAGRRRPRDPAPDAAGSPGSLTHNMAEQLGALKQRLKIQE